VADVLTTYATLTPDKLAVVDDRPGAPTRTATFAELESTANRLANALRHLGVAPGERIIWCGKNSLDVVAGIHAFRKARLGAVPLNYRLTAEEAAYVVADSDAVVAWVDAEMAPLFDEIRDAAPALRHVVVFGGEPRLGQLRADDLLAAASHTEPDVPELEPEQVIYTSGTTGRPKGAVRKGAGGPEQLGGLVQLLGCTPDDVHVTCGPLYHSGPLAFLTLATAFGNTFVVQRHFDAEDWLRLVDRYRVTATFSAPTPVRMICNLPDEVKARYDRSSMRMMCANAAPWPHALKLAYLRDFPPSSLYEIYGATELGIVTVLLPDDQLSKPGSCGRPAPYVEVALFDDDGRRVEEPGATGELYVRASSVFATYHNAHDKYEVEHRDGDWHTVGDIAYFDDEGYVYICDRKKDMVITGGMNVYPAEIEAVLEHDPRIYEAAVIGLPSEEWGEVVHAVVVRNDPALTAADVIATAREHLAGYKVPRSVSFVDEIPKTGSNKVLKRELRDRFSSEL
jgi:acyl-CoA synthetase (AMP-forming)/AMP-acid ligase II